MLVQSCSRHAVTTSHVCHMDTEIAQQYLNFAHLLLVQLWPSTAGSTSDAQQLILPRCVPGSSCARTLPVLRTHEKLSYPPRCPSRFFPSNFQSRLLAVQDLQRSEPSQANCGLADPAAKRQGVSPALRAFRHCSSSGRTTVLPLAASS